MNANKMVVLFVIIMCFVCGCSTFDTEGIFSTSRDDCQTLFDFGEYDNYINSCRIYSANNVNTQWNLAYIYRNSPEQMDLKLASYYTELAASSGYSDAVIQLCSDYMGIGVQPKDNDRAFWWCSKAMSLGDDNAKLYIAHAYEYGIGTNRNLREALNLYKPLALNGDKVAQFEIAKIYYNLNKQDMSLTYYWLEKSYEQNYDDAIICKNELSNHNNCVLLALN